MRRRKIYLLSISLMYGILFSLGYPAVPNYTNSLNISSTYVGLYLASGGLGLLLFATLWGALGDIKDRNKIVAIIFAGFAVGQFLFGIFNSEVALLIASLISGIFFAGVLVNIYSYINDSYSVEQERNKMLSYTVSLYLFGAAIAYIAGGYLTDLLAPNFNYVFFIQSILLIIVAILMYFTKTDLVDTDHHLTRKHLIGNIKQVLKLPWIPVYTITLTFLISFSHNNIRRFLDYYVIDDGFNATTLGLLVFTAGIVGLVSNLYIAPFFLKRFHNFRFLQFQFLLAPLMVFMMFQTTNLLAGLYSFYMLYTVILAVYEPTAISFMSDNRAISQGILVGVRQSVVGLGMTVGFVVGGILYDINRLYVFYFSILFYIIVFVGFTILIWLNSKEVKNYRINYLKEVPND